MPDPRINRTWFDLGRQKLRPVPAAIVWVHPAAAYRGGWFRLSQRTTGLARPAYVLNSVSRGCSDPFARCATKGLLWPMILARHFYPGLNAHLGVELAPTPSQSRDVNQDRSMMSPSVPYASSYFRSWQVEAEDDDATSHNRCRERTGVDPHPSWSSSGGSNRPTRIRLSEKNTSAMVIFPPVKTAPARCVFREFRSHVPATINPHDGNENGRQIVSAIP